MRCARLALLPALLMCVLCSRAAEDDTPAPDNAELQAAGLPTDGPHLLDFFRKLTPSEADQTRLHAAVRELGDMSYRARVQAARLLVQVGRPALSLLRPALHDPDVEIARRARQCIDTIEAAGDLYLQGLAARAVRARQPAGAVEVLLAFIPFAEDEATEEEVRRALVGLGLREGKAVAPIMAALTDREPARRAAAAVVASRATDPEQRRAAGRLLADAENRVRFQVADTLLAGGDRAAVPVLIRLLVDGTPELAWRAEELLFRLAGEQPAPAPLGTSDNAARERCREAWTAWWQTHGPAVDLARLDLADRPLGLTLVCEAQRAAGDRVFECGRDGKPRWLMRATNPLDAQILPGGRILIAECNGGKVVEMNRAGEVLWSYTIASPLCCQRLPNGNTFIATYSSVTEVTRDGKTVYTHRRSHCYHAQKLRTGHILCIDSKGELVELDPGGKEIFKLNVGGGQSWACVEALPGGRFLLALGGNGKVIEIDRTGKVYWERAVRNPNSATRLPNGYTLVASHDDHCIYEFDRTGREVWRHYIEGRPFRARRR